MRLRIGAVAALNDLTVTVRIHREGRPVETRRFPDAAAMEDWLLCKPYPWMTDTLNYRSGAVGCWHWTPDDGRVVDYWPSGGRCDERPRRSALGESVLRAVRKRHG